MIKTAVFPVAGLGSRFLPATKAIPKEMLVVVDKPLIQYAVEEAKAAGIEKFIFITSLGILPSPREQEYSIMGITIENIKNLISILVYTLRHLKYLALCKALVLLLFPAKSLF